MPYRLANAEYLTSSETLRDPFYAPQYLADCGVTIAHSDPGIIRAWSEKCWYASTLVQVAAPRWQNCTRAPTRRTNLAMPMDRRFYPRFPAPPYGQHPTDALVTSIETQYYRLHLRGLADQL
jgi:hypothetical protein